MSSPRDRIRNFIMLLMQFVFERGFAAVSVIGIAYVNGPETFGRSAMLLAVPMAIAGAMRAMTDLVMREIHRGGCPPGSFFVTGALAGVLAFALTIASWLGIEQIADVTLSPIVVVFAALIPVLAAPGYVADGIMLHRERYDLSLGRKLIAGFGGVVAVGISYLGGLADVMIVMFFVGQFLAGTIFALVFAGLNGIRTANLNLSAAARLSAEGIGASLIFQALPRATELAAGLALGPASAAILRVSIQIVETISGVLFTALNTLIINYREMPDKLISPPHTFIVRSTSFALIFFLPVYLAVLTLPGLTPLREYYGEWLGLVPTLQIFGLLGIIQSLDFPVRAGVLRFGRPMSLVRASILGGAAAVVIIGIVAWMAPDYLALAYVLASAALMISSVHIGRTELEMPMKRIAYLAASCFIIYTSLFLLNHTSRYLRLNFSLDLLFLLLGTILLPLFYIRSLKNFYKLIGYINYG